MSLIVSSNHINRYQTIHKHNVLLSISSKNLVKKWWDVQCIYSMLANSSFKEDRKYGACKCKRNQKKRVAVKRDEKKAASSPPTTRAPAAVLVTICLCNYENTAGQLSAWLNSMWDLCYSEQTWRRGGSWSRCGSRGPLSQSIGSMSAQNSKEVRR